MIPRPPPPRPRPDTPRGVTRTVQVLAIIIMGAFAALFVAFAVWALRVAFG